MGLSASQARLLSITQRLNNNELESEIIANAKMHLANRNTLATEKYIQAIDSTKMDYISYDDTGIQKSVALTFNSMTQYTPLKNQYNLYNTEGQLLVSQLDAQNFKASKNLYEFLDKYNLVDSRSAEVENPEWQTENDRYNEELTKWISEEPQKEDYVKPAELEPVWIHDDSNIYNAISDISCFSITQEGSRCYMHVLAALLGYGTYTTSDGNTFDIEDVAVVGWNWNSCTTDEAAVMDAWRENLKDDKVSDRVYDGNLNTEAHGLVPVKGDGKDAEKYNAEGGGNCWQKCIDLLWELHFNYDGSATGGIASEEELKKFWYFVEVDIGEGHMEYPAGEEFDEEKYNNAYEEWENRKPPAPDVPKTIETTIYDRINDKIKGQWYTNLFNALDGRDISDIVSTKYNENAEFDYWTVQEHEKVSTEDSKNFVELDEELQSNADWLQFALTNGIVTMKQAALRLNGDITWAGVEFSSTSDIKEVEDSSKVAIAEAEYEKTRQEIQLEDRKYDKELKKLDTEHSALQKEIESIKGVMSKNTERSFTSFS